MELSEEAIKMRKEYYKKYRESHREQIKGYQANYWEKKAQEQKDEK